VDILGTELLREIFQNYHDSYGAEPKLFVEPTGEFWQTEAHPTYGAKLFQTYDYQALGYEFGIQGHGIYYSGINFCWYNTPHTAEGVQRKLSDLHNAAQTVLRYGQAVNDGLTYTGGWKLEKDALGEAQAESIIDHAAAGLGYRISFEDHDGHIEDEPAGISNSRASYYVYRADYGDGVQIVKIDFNGGVTASCSGNTSRCETPAEAVARLDATLAAKNADTDPSHVYFFAFTIHSDGVWADFNRAAGGQPMVGEGAGLLALLDAIEARKSAGTQIRYVTPGELASIFEAANASPLPYEASPFGFHPASVGFAPNLSFTEAQDMAVRWHRPPVYAFWFLIQPNLSNPTYNWAFHDAQYGAVPAGINILANITVGPESEGYSLPGSYLPVDTAKYQAFVRATVERYDGDGIADMPGLTVPIRYWQVDNEPKFGDSVGRTDFAQLEALTYTAIKDACPNCQVLIGGATGFPEGYVDLFLTDYAPILTELSGQYVDIFDFHWYGTATGDYLLLGDALAVIRAKLQETGFGSIPIWVTEMGTYSGDPVDFPFEVLPYQSEEQQAADLLKRFVHPISLGIQKVFPAFGLIEGFKGDNGYFDYTGLIYDGQGSNDRGRGVKKVGYYTYKLMTQKLEGAVFNSEISGLPANVHGYNFTSPGGSPITVLWYDDFAGGSSTQDVTVAAAAPSVLVTNAVTDQQGNVSSTVLPVTNGSVTLTLGQSPVFVEPHGAVSIWLISGKVLRVSDKATSRITLISTDTNVTSPAPDDQGAPTTGGAVLELISPATGETDAFALPAANWKGLGTTAGSTGYRYTDTALAAGPCRKVRIQNGKRLRAQCQGAGISFSLDEVSQGSLGLRLMLASGDRYCMLFGGTIVKDEPGLFKAKDAPAPAACP
jgi:hypothetical protein